MRQIPVDRPSDVTIFRNGKLPIAFENLEMQMRRWCKPGISYGPDLRSCGLD
jgi:hypothetical protein